MHVTSHRLIIFLFSTASHTKLTFPVRVKFEKRKKKKLSTKPKSGHACARVGTATTATLTSASHRVSPATTSPSCSSPHLSRLPSVRSAAVPFPVSSSVLHLAFYARVLAIFDFLEHQNI